MLIPLLMAGCSKGIDPEEQLVEIKLNAGNAATKAPIASYGQTSFSPTVAGWEVLTGETVNYTLSEKWVTTTSSIAYNAVNAPITLTTPQNYAKDKRYLTYIKSWYPAGNPAGGIVTFSAPMTDGSQDILYSQPPQFDDRYPVEVSGSKFDVITTPVEYWHPLSQFKVVAYKPAGIADEVKVLSIKLKGSEIATGIDLDNDELITVPKDVYLFNDPGTPTELTNTSKAVGDPVMVKPFDSNIIYFEVVTNQYTDQNVKVTLDVKPDDPAGYPCMPGRAYTITLKVNTEEITVVGAKIISWKEGETGSGEL